jgi:hypothetical protein
MGRVSELGQAFVERTMLAAVHRLLPDEAFDLGVELWVVDVGQGGLDGPDEVVLAVREHRRQHGEDVAHHDVAIGGEVLREVSELTLELHLASGDRVS